MSSGSSRSSTEPQEEDPGAYPIPFSTFDTELGSRLDSIRPSLRYWAVNPERADARWYKDIVEANNKYEEWLNTRPPGEYPVPFGGRKRLDEIEDSSRSWGIHPDRSSFPWYNFFVRANQRYEQHLAATRQSGEFPYPQGNNRKYTGMPIKDIPQNAVWWALRPSNRHQGWYQALYHANKRMLDDVYKSRSPGSELIWFGKRYQGLRLDQVYERKGFMRWCLDPQRGESATFCRLRDLVERLEQWRRVHPERSGPRRRRKVPNIQNPVGEAVGPWDDSPGSAGEDDDYDKGSFIQSDSDELEYATSNDDKLMGDNGADSDDSGDSDGLISSSVEMKPSARRLHKRRHTNVILSDEELEESDVPVGKLGKRYRVQYESSEE